MSSDDIDYAVGDIVETESNYKKAKSRNADYGGWNKKMQKLCGAKGIVRSINEGGKTKVVMSGQNNFSWAPGNLTKVCGGWDADAVTEGATVTLREEVTSSGPSKGWGTAKPGQVGEVTEVDGYRCTVNWPTHEGWRGYCVELEAPAEPASQLDVDDFNIGDDVQWSKHDDDIDEGEVGEVVGHHDNERVKVKFAKGTWNFKPHQLTVVASGGFVEGDYVTWTNSDSDVPAGAIGTVIDFPSEVLIAYR